MTPREALLEKRLMKLEESWARREEEIVKGFNMQGCISVNFSTKSSWSYMGYK